MSKETIDKAAVVAKLNQILEMELAGVVRYTHYSLMVFGYGRIPIVSWLRNEANEALMHAQEAGEMITQIGAHPSLGIGPLLETHKHDIGDILRESLQHEMASLRLYYEFLDLSTRSLGVPGRIRQTSHCRGRTARGRGQQDVTKTWRGGSVRCGLMLETQGSEVTFLGPGSGTFRAPRPEAPSFGVFWRLGLARAKGDCRLRG